MKLMEGLNLCERGIFLSLMELLFHEGHYAFLYDENTKKRLTLALVKQRLVDMNVSFEGADIITARFIEREIFTVEGSEMYCPELIRQEKVSKSRKRTHLPKRVQKDNEIPRTQEPVTQEQVSPPQELTVRPFPNLGQQLPLEMDIAKADIIAHMKLEKSPPKKMSAKEQGYLEQAKEVLLYLNEKSQSPVGFSPIRSNTTNIIERLREGHTVENMKTMIDYKVLQWKGGAFNFCLRPKTLFIPKNFTSYVNEALFHFKAREAGQKHALNKYILKHFPRVSAMRIQMSVEQCEKVIALTTNKKIVEKLKFMENSTNLDNFEGVYLRLLALIENDRNNNETGVIKSKAI